MFEHLKGIISDWNNVSGDSVWAHEDRDAIRRSALNDAREIKRVIDALTVLEHYK